MTEVPYSFAAHQSVRGLFLVNGFLFASLATRIPAIQSRFSLSDGQLGLALMVIATGAVIAMPITGWCCSRVSGRTVAVVSIIAYLMGLLAIAFAPSLPLLVLALFFFGIAHGALDVAMNVQAVELERRRKEPIMSAIHAFWSVGGLAGAMMGGLLAAYGFGIGVHFVVISAMFGLAVYPISIHLLDVQRADSSTAGEPPLGTVESKTFVGKQNRPIGKILILGIIGFCVMAGEGAMADWSAVLLNRVLGTSEGVAAMGFAAFAVAMAGGRFTGDILTKRLGARNHLRVSGGLAAAGILLVVLASHVGIALLGFACVGAGLSATVPIVFSACGNLQGVTPGVALATVSTLGYFGFLLGPPLIGLVADYAGLRLALSTLVITCLTAVALASVVSQRRAEGNCRAGRPPAEQPVCQDSSAAGARS